MADSYDKAAFARLQGRLAAMWPLDLRSSEPVTAVVVSSITADLPEHIDAVIPPYEERYLFFVFVVARAANCLLDPDRSVLMPFIVTEAEAELALRLGIPVYGPDPALEDLGSKSGSREVFARAGVPMPRGVERLYSRADLVVAVKELQRSAPMAEAIVKTTGRVGITAIGDSAAEARSLYESAQGALDEAAEVPPELRNPPPWRPPR